MSVEKAAAPPFPSQALVPHPFRLSAAAAGSGGAHSLRTRRARRRGGRRRQCAEGRRRGGEEAEWSGWMHKESCARVQETRNEHRGQRRSTIALTRPGRGECGGEARFGCWVAEAAPVAVVVCTGPPSRSTIAAPLPRSPASGVAWRQGFGLDTCWRRGALGVPAAAAGTHGCHRPLRSTQPAPLLRHDGGAPLSTTARSRGWRRPPFMSALGGGGGRQQSQRRGGGGGGHSSGSPGAPSAGRRSLHTSVVRAHGPLLLSSPIAGSPPTPPFGLRRVRRAGRPAHPATPSPPIRHPQSKQPTQTHPHAHSSTKHMYVIFKHITACKRMHS